MSTSGTRRNASSAAENRAAEKDGWKNALDDDSKAVLATIQEDGTFDDIRHKVINELKKNTELKDFTMQLVRESNYLKTSEAKAQTKQQLFIKLRQELDQQLMKKAADAAWSVLSSSDSEVSTLIDEKVHSALCNVYEKRHEQHQMQWGQTQHAQYSWPVPMPAPTQPQHQQRRDQLESNYDRPASQQQRYPPRQSYDHHAARPQI